MAKLVRKSGCLRDNAWLAIPCLVFALHALLFRHWIIDDAGITFAYSRNLAAGFGLVSQPGVPPVEGYSNFLWVLTFAPFFLLRIFEATLVPKLLSLVLVLGTFGVLYRVMTGVYGQSKPATAFALTLVALNPSFVIWTTSGLENPLFVFLISLLFVLTLRLVSLPSFTTKSSVCAGVLTGLIAMTRPDGLIYAVMYPVVLACLWMAGEAKAKRSYVGQLGAYLVSLGVVFGGFLAFRLSYFHEIVPNTYHAKGGPSLWSAIDLLRLGQAPAAKAIDLGSGAVGLFGGLALAAILAITVYLFSTRRFQGTHAVMLLFLAVSSTVFILMPNDWMGEYRFASPFFVFFFVYGVMTARQAIGDVPLSQRSLAAVLVLLAVVCLANSGWIAKKRSIAFAKDPVLPYARISENNGHRYNAYAKALGVKQGSILVPDLGGTLMHSELRVYDLGMLCDKTIARTLGKNQQAFYDYVFDSVKPTFIHTDSYWAALADLDADPRFREMYVPIKESLDDYVMKPGHKVYAGDYVRKDAINGDVSRLEELRDM